MAIDGVSYNGPKNYQGNFYSNLGKSVKTDAETQATAGRDKFYKLQSEQKRSQKESILSSVFNSSSTQTIAPLNLTTKADIKVSEAPVKATEPAVPKETNVVEKGNTVLNTQSTKVSVTGGKGNTVTGATGWASRENAVSVAGANNNINIAGKNISGASEFTYNATGGPDVKSNNVNVTGNGNSVMFSGQNIGNNTLNMTGNSNSVDLASGIKNVKMDIQANNVSVTMKGNNPLTKSQSDWNVNVGVDNINVSIVDGKATVTGAGASGKNVKIDVNNETHSVTVSDITAA